MSDLLVKELVANTAYLRAQRQDRNELRKERLSLTLPVPKNSATLQEAEGKQYESLCEQQPIGRELFRQFLLSCNPQYAAAIEFLDELRGWSSAVDDDQEKARQNLVDKFCHPASRSFLSFLKGDSVETGKRFSNILDESSVNQMREATRDFLRGKPFSEFLRSPFFFRFLQWKEYERQKISDKYFREFRMLGKGGFGEVCAVQVRTTGQMYACKKLDKRRLKKKGGERLALQEKQILAKVNNLFIVNLAYAYENNTHLCLVMDLMNGGDLRFHIYELGERGLCMNRVVYYAAQMTMGLLHLHSLNIVYRDLKPENVLLDASGHCRLSDLGLAVELPNGKTICQKAGTTGYMAPEMLTQQYYSTSVDWWALGCCIYEMVAARLPFRDFREKVLKSEVTRRTLEDLCKFHHKGFDSATKDVICCLLKKKVAHRLGCQCEDPRKHPFFKSINFHLLEARRLEPPWMPKPNVVYAKDTNCFNDTSEVVDIELDAKDENFFKEFSTGAVAVSWQKEMIDSGLFDELNKAERNDHERAMAWKSKTCDIL